MIYTSREREKVRGEKVNGELRATLGEIAFAVGLSTGLDGGEREVGNLDLASVSGVVARLANQSSTAQAQMLTRSCSSG